MGSISAWIARQEAKTVLRVWRGRDRPMTVRDLALATGLHETKVKRALETLAGRALIEPAVYQIAGTSQHYRLVH